MDELWRQEIERAHRMTPDERIREGFALFEQGQNYILGRIRETFPDAPPETVTAILRLVLKRAKAMGWA